VPSIGKYRKTYFALLRGLPEMEGLDRHDLQERLTGKRSTRQWSQRDWAQAVAQLQRWTGQHQDATPHIKEDRPHGMAREGGIYATWPQCRLIADLCDQVEWRIGRDKGATWEARRQYGPLAYVCKHLLMAGRWSDLREQLKRRHNEGSSYRGGVWRVLPRNVASDLIKALSHMAHEYPREEG